MTSVLSDALDHGITLAASGAYTAPFTITQTGSLVGVAYSNLSGPAAPFLENMGFVESVVFTNGGTIQNTGTIDNAGLGNGILMASGNGTITNANPGSVIYGGNYGIAILQGTWDITNAGSIGGLAGAAVEIATGSVINKAGASIYAHEIALKILNAGGTIQNAGAITGNQYGVFMNGGAVTNSGTMSGQLGALFDFSANATINNTGTLLQQNSPFGTAVKIFGGTLDNSGFIYGATGVYLTNGGTVFNAGTIAAERNAVQFGGDQASRLIIAPGAVFIGDAVANGSRGNTLELTAGQSTLAAVGTKFLGFDTIAFDAGADWQVSGLASALTGDAITGFTTADSLDIAALTLSGTKYLTLSTADVLSVSSAFSLTFSAANTGETFALTSDGHGGEMLTAFTGAPPLNGNPVTLQSGQTITRPVDTLGLAGIFTMKTPDGYAATAVGAAVLDIGANATTASNTSMIESNSVSPDNAGIVLTGASTFINTGTIMAATGIAALGNAPGAYIVSTKDISATLGAGIYLQQYGSALNTGGINAAATGILLARGGYAYNSGNITAQTGIEAGGINSYAYNAGKIVSSENGIYLAGAGAVSNTGSIQASADGIKLAAGGIAYNYGFISAATGISVTDGGTIVEHGTLIGSNFAASFTAGGANRFVMNSSSDIIGEVSGGGGVLELTAGKTTGTVVIGQFEDFGTIQVDAKAKWDLSGNFTTGAALVNDGDVKFANSAQATFEGAVSGTGTISLGKTSVTFANAVASSQKIDFSGTHETLTLADPSAFAASIGSFATTDTIDIAGISLADVTGTAFAKNVLTISEAGRDIDLTFASASKLSGDVFLLTQQGSGFAITLETSKMALLKPAAQAAVAPLPDLAAPAPAPSVATYITPTAAPGFLSTLITPTSAAPVLITLAS